MKTAIVGCGNVAKVHAECLQQLNDCQLTAFVDIKKERADIFASQYGGQGYTSLEELFTVQKPDVLHICTPHYLHVPMAIQALQHGIHVFMEKPPAISRLQWEMLYHAVDESSCQLGICFQNRYNPSVQIAKDLLSSGKAGKLIGARGIVTWNRDASYYSTSDWRGKLDTEGGGALINQSIHTLDLLNYFLGKPLWTEASMANHHLKSQIQVEDTLEAFISYESGNAVFFATTAYCDDAPPLIELICENMKIRIEEPEITLYHHDKTVEKPLIPHSSPKGKSYWGNGHLNCISDFYRCLKMNIPYSLNLKEIQNTALLMLAIYESARTYKPITL